MKRAIIIFTRVPIPGQTKTRMMSALTGEQCAKLHGCFLQDIRKQCEKAEAALFVAYTPEDTDGKLHSLLGEQKEYFEQVGPDLGERMYAAFEKVFSYGYEQCLLIGTDIPELKSQYLKQAFEQLEGNDVVFGRTNDGGYYLVGMKTPRKEVFNIPSYGHSDVWENTLEHLKKSNLSVGYTAPLDDMDTPEDLQKYYEHMLKDRELQDSETGQFVLENRKISIIIPIYNEETTIQELQTQLQTLKGKCEIIFVDGGSTDRTVEMIDSEFVTICSERGRAKQMNDGAKASSGDILFFLHCDSELPKDVLEEIRQVMKTHLTGCFGIAFHSKNFFMFICRVISNHRAKHRKIMFGDQGIFIDRNLFFEVGMYPELPIHEDYQFSLTLKEKNIKPGMCKHRIYTSDRRFPKGTIPKLKEMWKMNRLRKMYRDGVDIQKISDLYPNIR